jgi:hypothetical protein
VRRRHQLLPDREEERHGRGAFDAGHADADRFSRPPAAERPAGRRDDRPRVRGMTGFARVVDGIRLRQW